jgi:soluble lytic murein transglycosylase
LESGRENLSLAAQQAADDWYGLRAADLLTGRLDPFESTASGYSGYRPTASDRQEAGRWLSDWLGLESATGIGSLDDTLLADPRMARGMELWRLGLLAEARSEFEALRIATFDDALAQYRLASYFSEIGLYRSSILCAVRVIGLSPAEGPLQAPRYLSSLAYPTYYEDLAVDVAEDYRLDVRLVFALIRQESLFESLAYSSASAHGLMQVIPATGAEIAEQLGWSATYQTSDLYRPHVSLRFGTFYLAQQRDRFDRLDAALAGYNGGPFNAAIWLEEAGGDPDAFFEVISLAETRLYLERIKEHYAVYRTLYPNSSGGGER